MFTGMIEELGKVRKVTLKGATGLVDIQCEKIMSDVKLGDSIAVNGVCLTVTSFNSKGFCADASEETLTRTSLKRSAPGTIVNLERAMLMGGRFGGHIVQGHVDGVGQVLERSRTGDFWNINVSLPTHLKKFVAEKGSICIDGISLTVAKDLGDAVTVAVIPHTFADTNLHSLKPGDPVNIEVDVIARYMEKLLNNNSKDSRLAQLLSELD